MQWPAGDGTKVIFAVPNYNMRDNLGPFLSRLVKEPSDGIYLLDDASTDGSAEFVEAEFPDVTVVRGDRNRGAGANRNRLLPRLAGDELILFMDADLELRSTGLAATVRSWFANPRLGQAGGLILDKSGAPYIWNYGYFMDPRREARGEIYQLLMERGGANPEVRELVRKLSAGARDTLEYEIPTGPQLSRQVDWVSEGLFAIRADLFAALGGFDEEFRYHTGQDLGARIRTAGREVRFEPGITVRHLEIDVRGARRGWEFREGRRLYYRKHWNMNREVFDRLYPIA
jgi:GT2 family glycosyltransferase